MKYSYNWLKWYIPEVPEAPKLADSLTYHLAEVETVEKIADGDFIFDIKILPNRAHDLLSHQGLAREIASLLNIKYIDPTPKYKIPESKLTKLKIDIQTDKCRRYMGRIIREVKVEDSPAWVVKHLESIGQRSINNMVDAANLLMFDTGQPAHVFDLDKMAEEELIIRQANTGEQMATLDNKEVKLKVEDMVIADSNSVLGVAGIKGGRIAEVDASTKNIIIEIANFDPINLRKTGQILNIFTDARKRFENDLSPELAPYAMREFSALIADMCPEAIFEDIVDVYPKKQAERKLSFFTDRISKILGLEVFIAEVEDILKRYNFEYTKTSGKFEITVPPMRLDLVLEEDIAEEIGRVIGYDKLKPILPKINFQPKQNETYAKISWARNKLLSDGYSEVMTYVFRDKGEVEVMQNASDKKFLRTNLTDGLMESVAWNSSILPLLGIKNFKELKIFEIGTVFTKDKEEMHVAYNKEEQIVETTLEKFCETTIDNKITEPRNYNLETKFKMWSLFPFIARDVAVWVPEGVTSVDVKEIVKNNMGELVVKGPELFDEFKKDGKVSYAFRIVFQSYEKTLTDQEVNDIMNRITNKIKEKSGWQVR